MKAGESRLLRALGADPALVEDVLGDLAEEYGRRARCDGAVPARLWFVRECLRSAPHLAWAWLRFAARHSPDRLVALATGTVVTVAVIAAVRTFVPGPPNELVAGSDGVVLVNHRMPVRLPVRVLDRAGHVLDAAAVRYTWRSGAAASVSPNGVARCAEPGTAVVEASVAAIVRRITVSCEPVREVWARPWLDLIVGEPARPLPVGATDEHGREVTRLAGELRIHDATVVRLDGLRILPLAPGHSTVEMWIGNQQAVTEVTVYEPVHSFHALESEQRFVAAPVRLTPGGELRWPLPQGLFWLVTWPAEPGAPAPALDVSGPVVCMPALAPGVTRTHCLARGSGAVVRVTHPGGDAREIVATVALARDPDQ